MKFAPAPADYKLPTEFVYVLIGGFAIVLNYVLTMYLFTMKARIQSYRRRFMKQFDAEHAKAFPGKQKAPQYGYPDCGNGRYSAKLPYADWLKMNNGQRAQGNYLEHLSFYLIVFTMVGLVFPMYSFYLSLAVVVGRVLFAIGYTKAGPGARLPGALLNDLAIAVGFVLCQLAILGMF